jgi:hypothetical protein
MMAILAAVIGLLLFCALLGVMFVILHFSMQVNEVMSIDDRKRILKQDEVNKILADNPRRLRIHK